MTCIVGIEHGGRVHLGADSAGSTGWTLTVRADEKVFKVGPFVMGFTTVSDVDGEEVWIQVDLEPCPDCGNDDPVDPPRGAA